MPGDGSVTRLFVPANDNGDDLRAKVLGPFRPIGDLIKQRIEQIRAESAAFDARVLEISRLFGWRLDER